MAAGLAYGYATGPLASSKAVATYLRRVWTPEQGITPVDFTPRREK